MDGNAGEAEAVKDLGKEIHSYVRVLLGAVITCVIGLVAVAVSVALWGGRIEQRVMTTEQRVSEHTARLTMFESNQSAVNARLGVIEERTSNIVKGIDRIETKIEVKK